MDTGKTHRSDLTTAAYSLPTSPRQSAKVGRNYASSPLFLRQKRSVKTLVEQCMSLREDLRSSFETMKGGLTGSLSLLEQVRKDVRPSAPATWRESDQYTKGRARIQLIGQQEIDRKLDQQVSMLRKQATEDEVLQKPVKVTVTRTQQGKGKKTRNVQNPMYIPPQMLGAFSLAKHLEKDRRGFGSASPKAAATSAQPKDGQIDDYLQEEIRIYEDARLRKMATYKLPTNAGMKTFTASTSIRQYLHSESLSSSLQYYRPFQDRKVLFELASLRRHQHQAAKMEAIQPSPEVAQLALRYIPKLGKKKGLVGIRIPEAVQLTEEGKESEADSSYSHADKFIEGEIQLELKNLDRMLTIATLVKEKIKQDLMKKQKTAVV